MQPLVVILIILQQLTKGAEVSLKRKYEVEHISGCSAGLFEAGMRCLQPRTTAEDLIVDYIHAFQDAETAELLCKSSEGG